MTVIDALVDAGLCRSRADARRVVAMGGVTIGGSLVTDHARPIGPDDDGREIRVGRTRRAVLRRDDPSPAGHVALP